MPNRTCILVLLFFMLQQTGLQAQSVNVYGTVQDSVTRLPMSNVKVSAGNGRYTTLTDTEGKYSLRIGSNVSFLQFSVEGFFTKVRPCTNAYIQEINVLLASRERQLATVVVNSKRQRYSNRNNPAVELIKQVVAHRDENGIGAYTTASYGQYEKLCMYLDGFPRWLSDKGPLKRYHFIFENKDTTKVAGKELVPIYIEENVSRNYFQRSPHRKNQVIEGQKKVDYGDFIDTHGVSVILNRLYEDINIYDPVVVAFTRQFISPISDAGPAFYKYFIQDTIVEENIRLVRLSLMPRNTNALLFTGTLYITLDGHYAVRKLNLHTNKNMNLGLVRNFSVIQDFEQDSVTHKFHLAYSDVITDFGLTKGTSGLFGERLVLFSNFVTGQPIADSLFKKDYTVEYKPVVKPDSFFRAYRLNTLSTTEIRTYGNIDSLLHMPSYKLTTDLINMSSTGYKSFGAVSIGPVFSFLSYNPVEGFKPRVGGRTTPYFSKRYYLDGYLAYGTKDQQFKYFGSATYSFNNRSVYRYPMHFLRVGYRHDTNIPGTDDEYVESNLLLSINSGANDKYLYNNIFRVDYVYEFGNHLLAGFGVKYKKQHPSGSLFFAKGVDTVGSLQTNELSATFRWAPHEQFYQNDLWRFNVVNRYPILTVNYTHGFNALGGEYDYNRFEATLYKRFYWAPFGYTDITGNAGYISGSLPWPLLEMHQGNQTLGYSSSGFNMMNYLEFVSDHYAGISIEHSFKGFFFDRIPLIRKLKWREVISGRLLYGGLRAENQPWANGAFKFPVKDNVTATYTLNSGPYFEAGAGITRIFKVLRIDVIRRFTYLNHPSISQWSVRGGINFEL
ncbi:DUF5686 family protein [Chitinophaga rupis]|nr:DUF5686 family protein [Chitinophaga rupis]